MTEREVVAFLANAAWQVPLLAAGAAILLRLVRVPPAWQCRIWSAVLLLALLLPANLPSLLPSPDDGRESVLLEKQAAFQPAVPVPAPQVAPREEAVASVEPGGLVLSSTAARLLAGLYLLLVGLGIARLLVRMARARRLALGSATAALPERVERIVRSFAARHGIRPPAIRTSSRLAGPAMVGFRRPIILIPEDFVHYREPEAITALLHECAHAARGDYGFNMLCELLAVPLVWHPAAYVVLAAIRDSREMACDRLAAEHLEDRTGYARSLVALAQRAVDCEARLAAAQPLLGGATLQKRVAAMMHADALHRVDAARLALASGILLPLTLLPAAMLHLTPLIAAAAEPAAWPPETKTAFEPRAAALPRRPAAAPSPVPALQSAPPQSLVDAPEPPPAPTAAPSALPASPPILASTDAIETGAAALADRKAPSDDAAARRAAPSGDAAVRRVAPSGDAAVPRASGPQPYSDADRRSLSYNGIGADEIAAFARAGYSNLTARQLLNLHYVGITSRFVGQLSAAGFPPFTPSELTSLYFQGVGPSEIAALGRIGHSKLRASGILMLHYRSVAPRFADRLYKLGYRNLSAAAVLDMLDSGMPLRPAPDERRSP